MTCTRCKLYEATDNNNTTICQTCLNDWYLRTDLITIMKKYQTDKNAELVYKVLSDFDNGRL